MSTSAETAFNEHAAALRDLGDALTTASSVRWEASRGAVRSSDGVPNPTLDIVLDPLRAEVSASITRTALALWPLTEEVKAQTTALRAAVRAWSGEPPASTDDEKDSTAPMTAV